uniref:Uncharacterized protein n=1 Tax=Anopheles merus TaxID=30066 RepID=A0A182V3E4_ANOME
MIAEPYHRFPGRITIVQEPAPNVLQRSLAFHLSVCVLLLLLLLLGGGALLHIPRVLVLVLGHLVVDLLAHQYLKSENIFMMSCSVVKVGRFHTTSADDAATGGGLRPESCLGSSRSSAISITSLLPARPPPPPLRPSFE